MTLNDFKNLIKDAADINWFNSQKFNLNFEYQEYKPEITSVTSLYKFVCEQVEGWQSLNVNFQSKLNDSKNVFTELKNQLEYFVSNFSNQNSDALIVQFQRNFSNLLERLQKCFTYNSPETIFLLDIFLNNYLYFDGVLSFMSGNTHNIKEKDCFIGAILAYEFSLKGKSQITKRGKKEIEEINDLKADVQKHLDASNIQITEFLKETTQKYQSYTAEIDEYKENKAKEVNDWFIESSDSFTKFSKEANNKITELEHLYSEKLKLSKPAEYWKNRATILKNDGWKTLGWLVVLILFGCSTLYFLLWQTPEGMLTSFFSDNKGTAIKWSIVFVTFISFLAFGIRALSKVMFSSFHLARDAEEREHLAYFYLALINEKAVSENDRNLVLQSLFSRSDSGLLKDDGSPSMPGVAEKIIHK